MPPDPLDLACFACQIVCSAHNYHAHYNVFAPPPFVNPGSAPVNVSVADHKTLYIPI